MIKQINISYKKWLCNVKEINNNMSNLSFTHCKISKKKSRGNQKVNMNKKIIDNRPHIFFWFFFVHLLCPNVIFIK